MTCWVHTDNDLTASNVRARNNDAAATTSEGKLASKPGGADWTSAVKTAKITLSDVDNSRGYELTVTGSGFNDGTTAAVYVLHWANPGNANANTWWEP